MADRKTNPSETAREEDYRDYDKRNLGDGWPYADEDALPAGRNAPYGSTPSNFDEAGQVGAEISDKPAIKSDGGPSFLDRLEPRSIEDDGLEEAITERLDADGRIQSELITVTVRAGVAKLSGHVETDPLRVLAETMTLSVPGVKDCINELVLIGADSHIPRDSDV